MKRFNDELLSRSDERHADMLRRSIVESDRKFWSGERPISLLQGIGVLVLYLSIIGVLVLGPILEGNWPKGDAPWWEKIVKAYGIYITIFVCLFFGNRRFRRTVHSPRKD